MIWCVQNLRSSGVGAVCIEEWHASIVTHWGDLQRYARNFITLCFHHNMFMSLCKQWVLAWIHKMDAYKTHTAHTTMVFWIMISMAELVKWRMYFPLRALQRLNGWNPWENKVYGEVCVCTCAFIRTVSSFCSLHGYINNIICSRVCGWLSVINSFLCDNKYKKGTKRKGHE